MPEVVKDNIIWRQSYSDFHKSMLDRLHLASNSLGSLKNQDSLYADEHRRLIAMYAAVLDVVESHKHETQQ
jgi:hypothetical protein